MSSSENMHLSVKDIDKQIMYWNIDALNNVIAYSDMIERVQKKQKPNKHDLEIRDFYFTKKITVDGKFQPESFLDKSIDYLRNFRSLDKNSYLQSVNFENNLKKYRFWKNLVSEVPKDKEANEAKQVAQKALWAYRFPTFLIFSSMTYVFMAAVGFTKMKISKQVATMAVALYVADVFVQSRKSSEIFYTISYLSSKELEKSRKELINKSVILDGKIYILDQEKSSEKKELIEQAKFEEDQNMKKALLEAADFEVIDSAEKVF